MNTYIPAKIHSSSSLIRTLSYPIFIQVVSKKCNRVARFKGGNGC